MGFKIEFEGGTARVWRATDDGATAETRDYDPSLYVGGHVAALRDLRTALRDDPKVAGTGFERWHHRLRSRDPVETLRIDLERVGEVRTLAREILGLHGDSHPPGTFRLFNVDFSPGFRYCVETRTDPTPARPLSTLRIDLGLADRSDGDVSALALDGDPAAPGTDAERAALRALAERLHADDPDVLVLSSGRLVPLLFERADTLGLDGFRLGRRPGWTKLAGANTVESYGRIGHSPARYDVPGRVIVDRSNSFLWDVAGLPGLVDLVERSRKPLQEAGWASIGNVLTAVQIREALARDVLVPREKRHPEGFKDIDTLQAADRGGFTFDPDVGLHEDVVEVDFASLYPSIMCEYNVSPDTVCCDCHADRADVPGLGYSVCDRRGFLADVLEPIVADRAAFKRRRLKWILVSCFGYQGYRNSKFGRIECHEAINAFAREILLDARDTLEAGGWRVLHGIVDSLWVTPRESDPTPIPDLTDRVTADAGIRLEHEADFEWICFVPTGDGRDGALTEYFGKVDGRDAFKLRGIEARQRSTPAFVADVQRDLLRALDRHRAPEPVCDRLQRAIGRLERGNVDPADLVIRKRVSKPPAAYTCRTRTVAALERLAARGIDRYPGQDVRYVVADDECDSADRVRLPVESIDRYDAGFYADLLTRACESVVAPLGWDRDRVRRYLRDTDDVGLSAFE
ncbi:DNA polymerase I [Halobacteriales archaeon QS_1_68_17]|nr:MAG: DNA polymerase I [Halobacteriales archaeon QS_1_68_17]